MRRRGQRRQPLPRFSAPFHFSQAFGNAVQPYLSGSFAGPTWAVRLCEFFALLQIVG